MVYESIILNILISCFNKIVNLYNYSFFHKLICLITTFAKRLLDGSRIWTFIKRPDYFTRVMMDSTAIRLLDKIINAPIRLCLKFYAFLSNILSQSKLILLAKNSLLGKLIKAYTENMPIVIGSVLALIMIVKHNWWNNLYITIFVIILLILFFAKAIIDRSLIFNIKALDFVFILFVLCIIVSMLTSAYPKESIKALIFYVTDFVFVLLIVSSVKSKKDLNAFLTLILAGVTLTGLYGLYQYKVGVPVDPRLTDVRINEGMPGRIFSTLDNANNYAEFLVMFLPLYAAAFLNSEKLRTKFLFILAAVPVLAVLVLTGSRSGMGAVAVAGFIFLLYKNWRLVPVGFGLGLLSLPLLPPWVIRRFMTVFNPNDSSIDYRGTIYENVMPMFKEFWFTGVGLGNGAFAAMSKQYDVMLKSFTPHAHNLFLQLWLEMGFIGILVFVWFIFRTLKKCSIFIFDKTNTYSRQSICRKNILMAGIAGITGVLLIGLVEHVWFYPRNMLFFWVLIGLVYAAMNVREEIDDVELFTKEKKGRPV